MGDKCLPLLRISIKGGNDATDIACILSFVLNNLAVSVFGNDVHQDILDMVNPMDAKVLEKIDRFFFLAN